MEDKERQSSIWLEVANVRLVNNGLDIQVKGDRVDREPVWWKVNSERAGFSKDGKADHNAAYRAIAEGLDKKRIVLANLVFVQPEPKAHPMRCKRGSNERQGNNKRDDTSYQAT